MVLYFIILRVGRILGVFKVMRSAGFFYLFLCFWVVLIMDKLVLKKKVEVLWSFGFFIGIYDFFLLRVIFFFLFGEKFWSYLLKL